MPDTIQMVRGREILSGVGRPTVEVEVTTARGNRAVASAPAGTSTGKYETRPLYDGGTRYRGCGVRKAVENVDRILGPAVIGMDVLAQDRVDQSLIDLDGTPLKERLGANAILAVSLAVAKAGALAAGLPLYRYLGGVGAFQLPVPLATVLAGGRHSPSPLPFEDYLISLRGFGTFGEAVEALSGIHATLGALLRKRFGHIPDVGGAYAPPLASSEEAFEAILDAVEQAGHTGRVTLGLDVVGSDLYEPINGAYHVAGKAFAAEELLAYFVTLTKQYPLEIIEDPFEEDDFEHHTALTRSLPEQRIVGDDLFATNAQRVLRGIESKAANTLLLKVNQAGTVTEAYRAGRLARDHGLGVIVSLRSGDTNDSFIADLAVGLGAAQIKLGGPVRGERNAKYNRLLCIEQDLGVFAGFAGGPSRIPVQS
jgi:enolase